MAMKADNSQNALTILVHGLTTVDGAGLAADAQVMELVTTSGDAATRVGAASPLPVKLYDGAGAVLGTATNPLYIKSRDGGYVDENGNTCTTGRAFVNAAAATADVSLVTATAGKSIRVLQLAVVNGDTAVGLAFNTKPAGASTAISPFFDNLANGGEVLPYSDIGWFQTSVGDALTVTTTGGSNPVGVIVGYALV